MGEAKRKKGNLAEATFAGIEQHTYRYVRTLCGIIQKDTGMDPIHKIRWMMEKTNEIVDEGTKTIGEKAKAQCSKGCFYCCAQMVTCSPMEIFIIGAEILYRDQSDEEIVEFIGKLNKFTNVPAQNKARIGMWCPLLKNGECSIYEKRPNVCRTHLSVDREKCKTEDPFDGLVPLVGNTKVLGVSARIALEYVLLREYGVNIEPVELTHGLLIALAGFRTSFEAWLAGKDVFAAAHEINIEPISYTDLVKMAGERIKVESIEDTKKPAEAG